MFFVTLRTQGSVRFTPDKMLLRKKFIFVIEEITHILVSCLVTMPT